MKHQYIDKNFTASRLEVIEQTNQIIEEYQDKDLLLTLRQLYYQFVSRDLIANKQSEYKRLGNIISDGRLAGHIDWSAIEDRTRNLKGYYHNTDPGDAVNDALRHFSLNKWIDQEHYIEVWIEKEALTGVINSVCSDQDVPYFACKGYVSQSELWGAARRLQRYIDQGKVPVIIHLGDHDPSGIDMTRDIQDRFDTFNASVDVQRIALNYDQIEEYKPPPNPTKLTDSRSEAYVSKYGGSSWELDALEPTVMQDLVLDHINNFKDFDVWDATYEKEEEYKKVLRNVVNNWKTL